MVEKLKKEYEELKDVIEILPTKTKEAKSRKQKIIEEEKEKDKKRLKFVNDEIEKRLQTFSRLQPNPEIKSLEKEKETCSIVNEWSDYNTAFEKMHLDYYLYQLHRYYKEDLKSVNECLNRLLDAFKKVDITLSKDDFDFNEYAQDYMDKIILNAQEDELKSLFEKYYWKNSDFIKILEANFKSIYYRYEKEINKFYVARHQEFLVNHTDEEIFNLRIDLATKISNLKNSDPALIFGNFINGTLSLNDFKDIDKIRDKYFKKGEYSNKEVLELYNVLNEYNIIINYKYLFTIIRDKLEKKDSIKDVKASALKDIAKAESNLRKFNKKKNKKPLFGKPKPMEKKILEYNAIIKNIIDGYDSLDNACFDNLIYCKLTSDSSLFDVLKLITSNYLFFVSKSLENDKDENIQLINKKYEELREYILDNKLIMINNIALLDEKQIKQLIVEKYNLNNIFLTFDNLLNLEATQKDVNLMLMYDNIMNSGIKLDDIDLYLEYEKIKKEEQE